MNISSVVVNVIDPSFVSDIVSAISHIECCEVVAQNENKIVDDASQIKDEIIDKVKGEIKKTDLAIMLFKEQILSKF
uniref:hypothetical protein n=1 Tax=Campylobacter fetus TaxID=196 RepID=UPI0019684598